MATLKSLEKEIGEIKNVMGEAINCGQNNLAVWGKFDLLFNTINDLQLEIATLKERVNKLKVGDCECKPEVTD